jgi:hypothetical protein
VRASGGIATSCGRVEKGTTESRLFLAMNDDGIDPQERAEFLHQLNDSCAEAGEGQHLACDGRIGSPARLAIESPLHSPGGINSVGHPHTKPLAGNTRAVLGP